MGQRQCAATSSMSRTNELGESMTSYSTTLPAGGYLFGSERGGPITPKGVQQIVDRAARAAGLGELNVHPHVLRHSCGYYLSERGADLRVIQAYLGHRKIRHAGRYVQLSPRRFDGPWDG
jgi:site-specific recombinase XerD